MGNVCSNKYSITSEGNLSSVTGCHVGIMCLFVFIHISCYLGAQVPQTEYTDLGLISGFQRNNLCCSSYCINSLNSNGALKCKPHELCIALRQSALMQD